MDPGLVPFRLLRHAICAKGRIPLPDSTQRKVSRLRSVLREHSSQLNRALFRAVLHGAKNSIEDKIIVKSRVDLFFLTLRQGRI